ncbi:CNF01220-like protein [Mrakia frigida]|uniref:CNF01220-like protein n=1 Tax=Mrakia frigida TaxID=29902 RepID=UPI003FCC210D
MSSPVDLEKKNHNASASDEDLKADILDLALPAEKREGVEEIFHDEKVTPEEEFTRIRKKADWILLPLLCCTYGLQFVDKNALSSGIIFGLKTDTHLVGQQYALLTTIFYVSYLVAEFPMAYIMQRMHLGKTLSICVTLWGMMVMLLAACKNWAGLMVVRALLGVFEATVTPGFILIVASWYKTDEMTTRSLGYYAMNTTFAAIFGLIIYGLADYTQDHGSIAGWKAINLFLGACTVTLGIVLWFFLGTPEEVTWLSPEEKKTAKARILSNASGSGDGGGASEWDWQQARDTFKDPQLYIFMLFNIVATIPSGALGTFGTLVYSSFGFSNLQSILYGLPSSALQLTWIIICAVLIHYFPRLKFPLSMFSVCVPFSGFLAIGLLPTTTWKWTLWALYQMQFTFTFPTFLMWIMIPANVAGRTKKSVVSSCTFVAYCTGQMIGSQTFRASDAPRYRVGLTITSAFYAVEFLVLGGWWAYYVYENKRRDRAAAAAGISAEDRLRLSKIAGALDQTDIQNQHFRYTC